MILQYFIYMKHDSSYFGSEIILSATNKMT